MADTDRPHILCNVPTNRQLQTSSNKENDTGHFQADAVELEVVVELEVLGVVELVLLVQPWWNHRRSCSPATQEEVA